TTRHFTPRQDIQENAMTIGIGRKPGTFQRNSDSDALRRVLRSVNNEISYEQMAKLSALSLEQAKKLQSQVRRSLVREGIVFETVFSVGLRRMTDSDKVRVPATFKRRVLRSANRTLKVLDTIAHPELLERAEQAQLQIDRTILNAIKQQAKMKASKEPV